MTDKIEDAARSAGALIAARVAQLIGIPLILAAVFWVGTTLNGLQLSVARLETKVLERTGDRYTATDAKRDAENIGVRLEMIGKRIDRVEAITRTR